MNEIQSCHGRPESSPCDVRPTFAIYHPNPKGTGCAMKMDLHPAHDDVDGCIMLALANQKSIGSRNGSVVTFSTFDWENKICVKLDFADLCKMLQVFRGETESLEDGKGLYHRSPNYSTKIAMRHIVDVMNGYSFELYRNTPGRSDQDVSARIVFTTWEAMGIALAFENSIGTICFGIPKVIAHDTSAYRTSVRNMRSEAAA